MTMTYFLLLCALCMMSIIRAESLPPPVEQPGALDLYPPTLFGNLPVVVDHFRYSIPVQTFNIRYMGTDTFASGKNSPVLLYCGNEGAIEDFYNASGAMFEMAETIGAYVMFVEHRYYGESLPFGNNSFSNENLVYLSIEQALADFSEVLSSLRVLIGCEGTVTSSQDLCDVVLFGGSYGGMLAAWHRMKYPHLSLGAIASGAPVDFYSGSGIQDAFYDAFMSTFETYGNLTGCGDMLNNSLTVSASASLSDLEAAGVIPCGGFDATGKVDQVEQFVFYAAGAVSSLAMVDYPYPCGFMAPLPANPVQTACQLMNSSNSEEREDIAAIHGLLQSVLLYVNSTGDLPCLDLNSELVGHRRQITKRRKGSTDLGVISWNYQACTELLMEPITSDGYGFYPPKSPKQSTEVAEQCRELFNVQPRPFWMPKAFGRGAFYSSSKGLSNVLFIENSKDPWHVGTSTIASSKEVGVDGSVYRFLAEGGAHHQDLRFSSDYDSPDVHTARELELSTVQQWLGIGA